MTTRFAARWTVATLVALAATGCGLQHPAVTPTYYTFDAAAKPPAAVAPAPASSNAPLPTLIVNPVHASAGFDSKRIIYQREANKQEYFAYNEWVDTPARMLTPLLVGALERNGAFRAVVQTPSAAAGDLRLDLELVRLQQDFTTTPSRVRLTLHAYVMDDTSRRVLAWRDIQVETAAATDDPRGGVAAANLAVRDALGQLAGFCAEAARGWRPAPDSKNR